MKAKDFPARSSLHKTYSGPCAFLSRNATGLVLALISVSVSAADKPLPPGAVEARDVFLRIKDAAELPALERGQVKQIAVEPGDSIEPGQVLAELDNAEAKLSVELARIELEIAEKQYRESEAISIARATLEESRQLLSQTQLEAEATKVLASTDIGVRQATMESDVSKDELERAMTAKEEFSSSVSEQQMVKLTFTRDHDLLKLERAQLDRTVDRLRSESRDAIVAQNEAAVQRLERALQKAESETETAALSLKGLEKQVEMSQERVERRTVKAPFSGVVVERLRSQGEWAEAGEPVLRIIRMDVLAVEGFVGATLITADFRGHKVIVECGPSDKVQRIEGMVVFVSPEIDAVSQQVLVRAEIRNPKGQFRPGQPARMWIFP